MSATQDSLRSQRRLRCAQRTISQATMDRIPGFIHFYKPVTIPALLNLFRDNLDDGITTRRCEQLRLFFLRQCEKYASTGHIILSPTKKVEPPPTRDVNRDSGTASANGGWLQRLVRRLVVNHNYGSIS